MRDSGPLNLRVLSVARREYLARVRSRWFLFSTLIVPVLFIGAMVLPVVLAEQSMDDPKPVQVIDQAGDDLADRLIESLRERAVQAERLHDFTIGPVENRTGLDSIRSAIIAQTEARDGAERPAAWLYLPPDLLRSGEATLVEARDLGGPTRRQISDALQETVTSARLERSGLSPGDVEGALEPVQVSSEPLQVEEGPAVLRMLLGYVFSLALYVMFVVYGQMIARGVLEEKTSDIVEILISSVRPWEMMLGKIIGIGGVGLTQVAIWALLIGTAAVIGLAGAGPALAGLGVDMAGVAMPWDLVLWSVVYFVTGYLLYSGVFAAAGAMVTSEQDVQQVLIPALIPIILPILIMPGAMQTPDATWVVVMSLIPLFSPILMPMRIAAGDVPLWQVLLTVVLMLGTTVALARAAGRIYRIGILMKGQRPNLPEFVRWLRHG